MLLEDSGLSAEIIEARGYRTVEDSRELIELGFGEWQANVPGLLIPIHGPQGSVVAYSYRPDNPRLRRGKPVKYEWAKGVSPRLDVPPSIGHVVSDPSVDLWITEGSKKADAAVSRGVPCLALIGVWNFRGKNSKGGSLVIGDFDHVAWNGRHVYLAFDSDVLTKPSVRMSVERLKGVLESRKAKVTIIRIPASGDEKVGLDDYLAAGGSVKELIEGDNTLPEGDKTKNQSLAAQVIELLEDAGVEFWHDESDQAYASYWVDDHIEHSLVEGKAFGKYCNRLCFLELDKPLGRAKQEVLDTVTSIASFEGSEHMVGIRVAHTKDACYLFLADEEHRSIKINAEGWTVVSAASCPVRFVKRSDSLPLPVPVRGGNLDDLRRILKLQDDDWTLVKGFLVSCFLPRGTFPILAVGGEQGSGKTFACSVLRRLIDPVTCPVRRVADQKDFPSSVTNGFLLAFDNLSGTPTWLSDTLCALLSGTGFTSRALYTNSEEHLVKAKRPVIINGIDNLLSRGDLADRAISVTLSPLGGHREAEGELEARFEALAPGALGDILDRVARAFRRGDEVKLDNLPRLADAVHFITASEPEGQSEFIRCLKSNKMGVYESAASESYLSVALRSYVDSELHVTGSAGEILASLNRREGFDGSLAKLPRDWPDGPQKMANQLRRLAPIFRGLGYSMEEEPRSSGKRPWRLAGPIATEMDSKSSQPSHLSFGGTAQRVSSGSVNDDMSISLLESSSLSEVSSNLKTQCSDNCDDSDTWGAINAR